MLPNWLYGKSKSKLASILGVPADYEQVKAQVTQNTEDIEELTDEKVDVAGIPRQKIYSFAPNSTTITITVPLDKVSAYAQGSLHIRTSSKDSEAHITFALNQGNTTVVTSIIKNYGTVDLSLDSMTISGQELSIVIGGGAPYQWYSAEYFVSLSGTTVQPTWNFA